MKPKLTKKQALIYEFIVDFTKAYDYSPSYREIMSGVGLTSVSAVSEHIDNLVEKGVLKRVPGAARSLEIVEEKYPETTKLFNEKLAVATEEEEEILKQAAKILGIEIE